MPGHDVIVIGASAGGVEALRQLVKQLPPDLPAALFVVLHVPASGPSVLPRILERAGSLSVIHAEDGQAIRPGWIYVAPPDRHLLVRRGYVQLVRSPREHGHRPAVDPLFRTAARTYGTRVVGVVLSGNLDDGTSGLHAVKIFGGVAVVQDPDDALYTGMPTSAIENVDCDYVLPISELAPLLVRLAHEPVAEEEGEIMAADVETEADFVQEDIDEVERGERPRGSSTLTCPECGGVLWELDQGELIRFRCHVGHAYSGESLYAEQSETLEAALWTATRALEERAMLVRRLASRARERGHTRALERFQAQAEEAEAGAAVVRGVLLNGDLLSGRQRSSDDPESLEREEERRG